MDTGLSAAPAAAAAATLLLADAAIATPSNTSDTNTYSSSASIASSHDIVTLSACFQFLSPKELIQAHSTCRQWHLAAANPLTFRAQIRVLQREHVGIISTGPKVSFSRPNCMKLAFESSLFQNFRILHLIGAHHHSDARQHKEEWRTMIQSTLRFKSFHTLRLSLSNLGIPELFFAAPDRSEFLLDQLFQSATCKYLQVLTFDITPYQFSFIVDEFMPHFPRGLRHLQLNLLKLKSQDSLIPDKLEEQVAKLTELRSLVIADDDLRLLVHSRMSGVIKQESFGRTSLLTLTEPDIAKLSSLFARIPALDIRCIVCIDMAQLVYDSSPLIRKVGDNSVSASSSSSASASSASAAAPSIPSLQLEEIYIKNVSVLQAFHGNLIHLLTHLAPRARSLSLIDAHAATLVSEAGQQHESYPNVAWPATLVESLTSLQVIYGHWESTRNRYLNPSASFALTQSNLLFAAARFTNLSHLTIGQPQHQQIQLNDELADFFATLPSLTHLSLYAVEVNSFASLVPLRKLRLFSGLNLARQLLDQRWERGFTFQFNDKQQSNNAATSVSVDFQRALEHVTEIDVNVPRGHLTAPLLFSLLSLPSIEKVCVNGGTPLSRKMLRIQLDKIEKIRQGFKEAAEGHEKLEEELKAKKDSVGYGTKASDIEELDSIEVDENERRSLRSSLLSTLLQAREQEKIAREQLSHTEYEARVGGESDLTLSAAAKFRASRSKKGPCVFDGSAIPPLPDDGNHSTSASSKTKTSKTKHSSGHKQRSAGKGVNQWNLMPTVPDSSLSDTDIPTKRISPSVHERQSHFDSEDALDQTLLRKPLMYQLCREIEARGQNIDSDDDTPLQAPDDTVQRVILNDEGESVEEDELAAILCTFAKTQ